MAWGEWFRQSVQGNPLLALVIGAIMLVFLVGFILLLVTQKGRDALARLGLRIADALTSFLERWLNDDHQRSRRIKQETW
jgi:CHASE1-domain containing sensor protein